MEPIVAILTTISIANIIVLASLIVIFTKLYRKTRAQIPLAMITFCGFLLLHNIIGGVPYFVMEQLFSMHVFPYLVGIHLTELAGLLVFLRISSQ